tara:strand:+ start:1572 stop:2072 length:501 start_codon:yes stop_codon:yes gene_type:complete
MVRRVKVDKIKETSWAYLAGLMDGRGSFRIGTYVSKVKRRCFSTQFLVCTNGKLQLEWLLKTFGGRTRIGGNYKKNSPVYWVCINKDILYLCDNILPYLLLNNKKCEIMIEMRETYSPVSEKGIKGIIPLTDEMISLRMKLHEQLKLLHLDRINRNNLKERLWLDE